VAYRNTIGNFQSCHVDIIHGSQFKMIECGDTMLSGSNVTTAWRVLGLRIEETASRYGG
jgi:hypothetical protein